MPVLTDRQRIELAIPPYLLFALTGAPNVFVPATAELAAKAEQQIAELQDDLRSACFEPFADLTPMKRRALLRRLERVKGQITAGWGDQAVKLVTGGYGDLEAAPVKVGREAYNDCE